MRVFLNWSHCIDEPQLPCHPKVHHQKNVVVESDEDVLAAPSDRLDSHTDHRVDELFRFGVANDGRERQLASHDGAAHEMRAQVRDYRLDLR